MWRAALSADCQLEHTESCRRVDLRAGARPEEKPRARHNTSRLRIEAADEGESRVDKRLLIRTDLQ